MTLFEWLSVISAIIGFVFLIGKLYERFANKDKKVDTHDDKINELSNKVDKMSAKVNLIESESSSHKDNIHKMRNDLNQFMSSTNNRFEKSEKNQAVQLMLMSQLCEKQGIDTSMAEFLLKE